jgi:hypothetical protein
MRIERSVLLGEPVEVKHLALASLLPSLARATVAEISMPEPELRARSDAVPDTITLSSTTRVSVVEESAVRLSI